MSYLDQDPEGERAKAVKDSLARVGIKVNLKKGDRGSYFTTIVGSPAEACATARSASMSF